jgi:peptidoglycan/xylan/chitin deacetylase (PgdA/CDA1 family)
MTPNPLPSTNSPTPIVPSASPEDGVVNTPNPSGNNSSSSPVVPETVQKLYHMNKNYFIVPNDPDKTDKHVVLLTFDDGPKKKEWIESIINTLNNHHTKAIFFEIGSTIKANPDLLKFTYDSGETIGNHTWTHPFLN